MDIFLVGFITCASLIVVVGAQNAFVLRQGLKRSHIAPVVFFCIASDTLLIALGIAGLGVVFHHLPRLITAVRFAGILFLLRYGISSARRAMQGESLVQSQEKLEGELSRVLLTLAGLTYLNPNVYLDTVVLIGSVAQQQPAGHQFIFGLGASTASLVWFLLLGFCSPLLSRYFEKPASWQILDASVAVTTFALVAILIRGS